MDDSEVYLDAWKQPADRAARVGRELAARPSTLKHGPRDTPVSHRALLHRRRDTPGIAFS